MSIKNPSKTASLRNNKEVLSDLQMIAWAIQEGKLDGIFSLTTTVSILERIRRQATMSEIDEQIKAVRRQKLESVMFASNQIQMFSKYLRKNFHNSSRDNGYTEDMIFANIDQQTFFGIVIAIQSRMQEIKSKNPELSEAMIMMRAFKEIQERADERLHL